jgi:hypothetical protein
LLRAPALALLLVFLPLRPGFDTTMAQVRLAPGVLKVVPAEPAERDTVSGPLPLMDLALASQEWESHFDADSETLFELSRNVTLRRSIWQLEFAFKNMRMVTVETVDLGPRIVWYLIYRIRNTGASLYPVAQKDEFRHDQYVLKHTSYPVRFIPLFVLTSYDTDTSYPDRVIPEAVAKIHQIEIRDPKIKLYDSVQISSIPIEVSSESVDRSVWGVATWDDVDPRTDFFSVFVQGLTNAYQWEEDSQTGTQGGLEPRHLYKTLQLNFWRPGDTVHEHQGEFRYGLPMMPGEDDSTAIFRMYGVTERNDFQWVYRP